MLKRRARLKKSTIKKLIECFEADVSATQAAKLAHVNRNTANAWYRMFREEILVRKRERSIAEWRNPAAYHVKYFSSTSKNASFGTITKMIYSKY